MAPTVLADDFLFVGEMELLRRVASSPAQRRQALLDDGSPRAMGDRFGRAAMRTDQGLGFDTELQFATARRTWPRVETLLLVVALRVVLLWLRLLLGRWLLGRPLLRVRRLLGRPLLGRR